MSSEIKTATIQNPNRILDSANFGKANQLKGTNNIAKFRQNGEKTEIAAARPSLERSGKMKNMILKSLEFRLRNITNLNDKLEIINRVFGLFRIAAMNPSDKIELVQKIENQFSVTINEQILVKNQEPDFEINTQTTEDFLVNPVISSNQDNKLKIPENSKTWSGDIKALQTENNSLEVLKRVGGSLSFLDKFEIKSVQEKMSKILQNETAKTQFLDKLKAQNPERNYKLTTNEVLTALSGQIIQDILRGKVGTIWENSREDSNIFKTNFKEFLKTLPKQNSQNPNLESIEKLFTQSFNDNKEIDGFLSNLGSHLMLKNLFNN